MSFIFLIADAKASMLRIASETAANTALSQAIIRKREDLVKENNAWRTDVDKFIEASTVRGNYVKETVSELKVLIQRLDDKIDRMRVSR